ncbi:MAG: Sir2 silent information regulator family NAD-dependent deacetylase [Lachnospiraceae bacterium]|nr:Sir2 silent information regulator family NAD-dependent deacetylase [Lachnospiraceae bacterium]
MLHFQAKKQNIKSNTDKLTELRNRLEQADAVIIGAGAGLSTAAGFTYSGERFRIYFHDFAEKYQFEDMYSGGFFPYKTLNEHWAYWSRYIYINRYMNPSTPLYQELYKLVADRNYFVITTNVDHCFQKAGFDKKRLYYTQGDYGLFQCSKPCHEETYDNEDMICEMVRAQGWQIGADSRLYLPDSVTAKMSVPDELIPYCPKCGEPMSMNLRADDTFVQDGGWYQAAERYETFLEKYRNTNVLFLELGVGYNTPGIIKYPFWQMTAHNPKAVYACINYGEAVCPLEIEKQSICIDGDIRETLKRI